MSYPHHDLENRWQLKWAEADCYAAKLDTSKPKFYALDMFPYPSGAGLHVGHLASYTPTDIVSRYKRAKGFNVLHPMGYDAFGLPAEQYAIQTGIHPAATTNKSIESFRKTLKAYGFSFDWNREISTADPSFYKWTQFIFLKLYEKGLAYQKEAPVNWCPALRTVLANEEVVDGKSERGGHPVVRKKMRQWMLKITAYAERLLEGLDRIDWTEATKDGQRNWIGKSVGAEVKFKICDGAAGANATGQHDNEVVVFTTRPDTIFGVTFMVVAPEHPLLKKLTTPEQKSAVTKYVEEVSRKSDLERKVATEKTGVFTGSYAVNPLSDQKIPIWVADYVLMDYGTGAIMAVPGHDARDFEFAKKFALEVKRVLSNGTEESSGDLPFEGDGKLVNSDFLNGLDKAQAVMKAIQVIEEKGLGEGRTQYKLRDWLFSRQRYWGEPIPVVHRPDGTTVGLSYDELPLTLPEVADYEPSAEGEPPLARVSSWVTHKNGTRVTDTMPGSAGSSWYFLRYTDPHNSNAPFSFEAQKYFMPVDLYVGGTEHTVGHLLYARFWQKVLFDCGLVSHDEPFQKLRHQGVIMGPDGQRMSKSRGNVVNPDDVRETYGVDATRMYVSFMGPFDKDKPWDTKGIEGVRRFLERVWRLAFDENGKVIAEDVALPADLEKTLHKTIQKVGSDIENMGFNTAVSQMMILVNEVYRHNLKPKSVLKILAQLLQPFAPHFAEEIWHQMGGEGLVCVAPWPIFDPKLTVDDSAEMGVQVNGKMRGTVQISLTATEKEAVDLALQVNSVANALQNMAITKVIYKAGKILNLIAK